ncbi:MAG: hypothetical protein AB9869_23810 [Verrucomicrobiia bacterium]
MKTFLKSTIQTAVLLASGSLVLAQQPAVQERVVALKAALAASQAILKQYEWVETTVVSVKGEEKSRQMSKCYHGADGKVQKVPITTPAPAEKKRGLRGKIAESKKEEMTDYMKEAVGLVKMYVPPDQARIQAAKDAGKVSVTPLPGQRVRLTFADYLKTGDSLALDLDLASNRPLEAKVSTYLDSPQEPVLLDVRFSTLDNTATYASAIALDAKAKNLTVNVQNSGYRRAGN